MNDDLRWNKIFGAILGTALFILLLRQGSEMLFETKPPPKAGYAIAVTESAGEGGAEAADVPPDWGTVLPTADVAAGATVANKCKSCHNFDNGGPNQTGPNLWGVEGRKPGSHSGFAYSSGMTDFGGKTPAWDYAHLYDFLKGPQAYINGTKMSFVGLKKRDERINLIAWLRQQGSSPPPIPAPDPKAAEAAKAPAPADGSKPTPNPATTVPAGSSSGPKPAATGQAGPTEAPAGVPTTGTTPAAGAAQQPSAEISSPGGKGPSGGAERRLGEKSSRIAGVTHGALQPGRTAVVTGAASGIGLAAAKAFSARGLNVVLADLEPEALDLARDEVAAITGAAVVVSAVADVSALDDVCRLQSLAIDTFGEVNLLMNNAAVGFNPGKSWEDGEGWRRLMEINLWGVINGVQAFVPAMLAQDGPGLIVNTGSKQGITLPPGNSAYNVSKAGVKAYTELLAHELRDAAPARLSAHLLIPGFTFTGMSRQAEKPPAAWSAEQVADFMLKGLDRGDFYLLCPDNETPREVDERRAAWMAGDLIENRPSLSRWHPDYAEAFNAFMRG